MARNAWGQSWARIAVVTALAIVLAACAGTPTAFPSPSVPLEVANTPTQLVQATPPPIATATPVPTAAPTAPPTATVILATPTVPLAMPVSGSTASLAINGQSISYSYPDGWRLKQETKDRYSQVSLEGPDGALVSLTIYSMDMEPRQLAASLLDTMKKQFVGATSAPVTGTVGSFAAEGYSMKFAYLSVPMSSTILSFRAGKLSFTLYTQAADEDLGGVQPGFDLVKTTFAVK